MKRVAEAEAVGGGGNGQAIFHQLASAFESAMHDILNRRLAEYGWEVVGDKGRRTTDGVSKVVKLDVLAEVFLDVFSQYFRPVWTAEANEFILDNGFAGQSKKFSHLANARFGGGRKLAEKRMTSLGNTAAGPGVGRAELSENDGAQISVLAVMKRDHGLKQSGVATVNARLPRFTGNREVAQIAIVAG